MTAPGKAVLFGFLVWLVAFVVAFAIFPLRESARPLFESIMPVVVTAATVGFGLIYFRRVSSGFAREALVVGLLWLAINIVIDLPLMLTGPIDMSVGEYFSDIGLTYAMIPLILIGMGRMAERARASSHGAPAQANPLPSGKLDSD